MNALHPNSPCNKLIAYSSSPLKWTGYTFESTKVDLSSKFKITRTDPFPPLSFVAEDI